MATRPFGSNTETIAVHLRALTIIEGNNPIVTGDIARKMEILDILPRSPDPDRDRYAFDPVKYAQEHRKGLLEAAFSIMRAYRQAGMPQGRDLPEVGSFEDWGRKVRDLVYWLTGVDVAEGFRQNKEEDPHRQNDAALLEALYVHFDKFRSADVTAVYNDAKKFQYVPGASEAGVRDALNEVFGEGSVTSKNFGYWTRRKIGEYSGDFTMEKRGDTDGSNVLSVRCTDDGTAKRLKPAKDAAEAARKKAAEEETQRREKLKKATEGGDLS
jgi:hypothetical protein